ncbi:hypothetical protein [Archaeoglobus fulgidus]|jgi:uncharacterized membrane protein|uniref:Uncharacterized protein AF_1579 n=1 Tax=Archaeoglobus fulgidus (strain ATCC 49558 / DSM 4304 / JCM 9628 / NBRC 100126 / VC-16) TaxID=224325 RepID=Y1579_ARCFU|nr:hypothetical protein [Archaeoglobus fulgidus]O28693.1 RecName: Full=Uncharacterized protein AF_1579 [Archaeoglobus fulgidus DSM 4304]AAB89669.1 predicted coding region AF_1579 [Archaeoglobus fulgidus DSM 4304]
MRDKLNLLIFFIAALLIALGLRFTPTISFAGLILLLAVVPALMLRFRDFFSREAVIAGIFVLGLALNALIGVALAYTKSMEFGMSLLSLLPLTLVLTANVFATSLVIRIDASGKEVFAFYFWFLISVGLAFLFLLPTGGSAEISPRGAGWFRFVEFPILYSELALIPSAFCLVFQRVRTFLFFSPFPLFLDMSWSSL